MLYWDKFTKELYTKVTIKWSFSYNFFVKFQGKNWTHNPTMLYPNLCSNEMCFKGAVIQFIVIFRLKNCLIEGYENY